jgi:hypothetical protein
MKKLRVNIAPNLGEKDTDIYIDIRFDAQNTLSERYDDHRLMDCVKENYSRVQSALADKGFQDLWKVNIVIMDKILEHYKGAGSNKDQ